MKHMSFHGFPYYFDQAHSAWINLSKISCIKDTIKTVIDS